MENLPAVVFVWTGGDPWCPWDRVSTETGEVLGRHAHDEVERLLGRGEVREFHTSEQAVAAGTLFGVVP